MKNQVLFALAIIILTAASVNESNASQQASLTLQSSGVVSSGKSTSNGIWLAQTQMTPSVINYLVANNIFNIYLNVGYPNPQGYPSLNGIVPSTSIGIGITKSDVQSDLALLSSINSNLKLWAWFGTYSASGHGSTAAVDISTASNRNALISVITSIAHDWGFYGVQDDTEDFTQNSLTSIGQYGSWQVDYWNAEATAAHANGLKMAAFVPAVWYYFNIDHLPNLTGQDYLNIPGMSPSLGTTEAFWFTQVRAFLSHTNLPVIIDLENDHSGDVTTQINWVNQLPPTSYPNLAGFAIYTWNTMDTSDWTSWNSFAQAW